MEPSMQAHFNQYPEDVRTKLLNLRAIIFQLAEELSLGVVSESLKWGEPSFSVKSGSPVRIDWKSTTPDQYYLFFHCQTKLVDTFRELYGDVLDFQGNRAIVLELSKPLPKDAIRPCLIMSMTYHKIKHLPLLGA
ncbi:hypothetical protein BA953_02380 [Vibrio coralliilyticus]|uniref:DUF1801 domain-containing protein n=1 Tax=Vibrio coralliilyticus TaxID=190893 RepID=UPI000810D81D|nr:DUF1801 domain-containing protein [Vibrio coralliilyticus]ANW23137.1 hypothetical protein BA953_02380 [Vibrio coralliilyticus]